jgi:hypothetical protein
LQNTTGVHWDTLNNDEASFGQKAWATLGLATGWLDLPV